MSLQTRWAKRVTIAGHQIVIDNFGYLKLNGQDRLRITMQGILPSPPWESGEPSTVDAPPDVTRLPDHLTGVTYVEPAQPLIHINPPPEALIEPKQTHLSLFPYCFPEATILAAYSPEINVWWIGRITSHSQSPPAPLAPSPPRDARPDHADDRQHADDGHGEETA